jgi:hypothetical protein
MNTLGQAAASAPEAGSGSGTDRADAAAADAIAGAALTRAWLWLGVAALAGAGLLAVLLALSRTPGIASALAQREWFRTGLVVHVDLSVLIWFVAFAGVLWSRAAAGRLIGLGWAGFALTASGTAAMTVSPFLPHAQPLLNNYVPVLQQGWFLAGIGAVCAGFVLTIVRALFTVRQAQAAEGQPALALGLWLAALAGAISVAALAAAWQRLSEATGAAYFELLFWGAGHCLQFQHVLLAAVAWLTLAAELGAPPAVGARTLGRLFLLAAAPLLAVPVILVWAPAGSPEHVGDFALLMRWGHLLSAPLVVLALLGLWRVRGADAPARSALAASLMLFAVGGVLGFLIRGANVVIPAHYHGSIVGITLAFMGLTYVMLPQLGFAPVRGRLAGWQPAVYGGGQLMHVLGLAWSGGYGVERKLAGADQVLTGSQAAAMGLMGAGGLLAVVGGLMFVLACLRSIRVGAAKAPG